MQPRPPVVHVALLLCLKLHFNTGLVECFFPVQNHSSIHPYTGLEGVGVGMEGGGVEGGVVGAYPSCHWANP